MRRRKALPMLARLAERRQEIEVQLRQVRTGNAEWHVVGPEDEMDRASEDVEFDIGASVAEEMEKEIQQISEAIEKIAAGTYGLCELCGEAISRSRLRAMPSASLCLRCKSEEERASKATASRCRISQRSRHEALDDCDGDQKRLVHKDIDMEGIGVAEFAQMD